jgi:hypothetical protein
VPALVRRPVHSLGRTFSTCADVGVQRGRDQLNIRAVRSRWRGPSDSQIYRIAETKLFVPLSTVRNTTYRPILRNQWQEGGALPCGHPGPASAGAPGPLLQHGSKRGAFYTTARTVAQVTARVREDRKPISADELFMADTDLMEPPPPLEEAGNKAVDAAGPVVLRS